MIDDLEKFKRLTVSNCDDLSIEKYAEQLQNALKTVIDFWEKLTEAEGRKEQKALSYIDVKELCEKDLVICYLLSNMTKLMLFEISGKFERVEDIMGLLRLLPRPLMQEIISRIHNPADEIFNRRGDDFVKLLEKVTATDILN